MSRKLLVGFLFFLTGLLLRADRASDVLNQVENNLIGKDAPVDISARMVMTILRGSDKKERELQAWTRNNVDKDDWRVLKFQSPADVRGIALLVLAEDQMYIYLPEFRRVRRIASSNKKDAFVGSDFSYEDLSTTGFVSFYDPRVISENDLEVVLELIPKKGVSKPYARIEMTVLRETMLPSMLKMFDKGGRPWKECRQRSRRIGNYNVIDSFIMRDLQKKSSTELKLLDIKLDSGLEDEIFSERFLKK